MEFLIARSKLLGSRGVKLHQIHIFWKLFSVKKIGVLKNLVLKNFIPVEKLDVHMPSVRHPQCSLAEA